MTPTLLLIFAFAVLTVYAAIRVVAPFFESKDDQLRHELLDDEMREIEELVARKSILLQSLRDVEFDHDTGKLSDEDYRRLRDRYEREAVEVMQELDDIRGGVDLDDEIDAELEKRLENEGREPEPADSPDEPDTRDGEITCPECEKTLEAEARFCSRCGTPLEDEARESDNSPAPDDVNDETVAGNVRSEAPGG